MRRYFLIVSCVVGLSVSPLTAEPIDTHDYGFIREGARIEAVLERVGQPDSREVLARVQRRAGDVWVDVIVERLVWRGTSQVMRTIVTTANGVIQTKQKVHEP